MTSLVRHSERGTAIYDCHGYLWFLLAVDGRRCEHALDILRLSAGGANVRVLRWLLFAVALSLKKKPYFNHVEILTPTGSR